jgi:hypothetical protein
MLTEVILAVALLVGAGALVTLPARAMKRKEREASDERAQLIAMGEGYGIEHVPGEELHGYRVRVINERDRRAEKARREEKH